jgi:hypothetical protein
MSPNIPPDISSDNRAMSILHVGQNNIPEKEMREIMTIAMRMDSMKILCAVPFKDKTLTELDVSGKNLGTEGALVVAEYLDGNRALSHFDISNNSLYAAGAKVIAEGLKGNQVITELNISGNGIGKTSQYESSDMSGVTALADVIPGMGALAKLSISSNNIGVQEEKNLQRLCEASGIQLAK